MLLAKNLKQNNNKMKNNDFLNLFSLTSKTINNNNDTIRLNIFGIPKLNNLNRYIHKIMVYYIIFILFSFFFSSFSIGTSTLLSYSLGLQHQTPIIFEKFFDNADSNHCLILLFFYFYLIFFFFQNKDFINIKNRKGSSLVLNHSFQFNAKTISIGVIKCNVIKKKKTHDLLNNQVFV